MRKKRTYIVPVAVEWDMEVEASDKKDAVEEAVGRMRVQTTFGANAGRNPLIYGTKARLKK